MSKVRVFEEDGLLHVHLSTRIDGVSLPFHLAIEFGEDLDRLVDLLRSYQYENDQREDANTWSNLF